MVSGNDNEALCMLDELADTCCRLLIAATILTRRRLLRCLCSACLTWTRKRWSDTPSSAVHLFLIQLYPRSSCRQSSASDGCSCAHA